MTRANAVVSHPEPGERRHMLLEPALPDGWDLYIADLHDAALKIADTYLALRHAHARGDLPAMQQAANTIRAEASGAANIANRFSVHVSNHRNRSTRVR